MTTDLYTSLMERHQAMQTELANQPEALATETILQFLEEARAAGAMIGEVRQREHLRAILRHWGGVVYDRQGDYPAIQLAPYEGEPISESVPVDQTGDTSSGRWRPFVVALVSGIMVILVLLVLIVLVLIRGIGAGGSSAGQAAAEMTADARLTLTAAVITPTPTPQPTNTPTPTRTPQPSVTEVLAEEEEYVDTDEDGLYDIEEEGYNTNPYAPDSDFDGLSDGEELNDWGTDPLNFDSDGDGLWDGEDDEPLVPATPTPLPSETPTPQTAVPHTVQSGETLETIAEEYGVSVSQLSELNNLSAQEGLQEGQELLIPLQPSFIVPEAVIKIQAVNLRSGPGIEFTIIAYPERGTFATILGQTLDPTWYLVELQDGKGTRGWLSAAVVRLLYPTRPETIPPVLTVPPTPAP